MYDTRLVVAAQEGDDAAFAALYDRYAESVYDFCWALAGDEHEASRMVQDAFVLAARHIDDITDASQVRPWLLAIARDRALAEEEEAQLRTAWGSRPAVGTGQDMLGTGDLRRWAREAGATLALADQAVLELAARHELDSDQLACAIGCDPEQLDTIVGQVDREADDVLGALVVARQGRKDCAELSALLEDWDGTPSVEVAEQSAAHIPGCERCTRRLALSEPRLLVTAAPRVALPTQLRAEVLDAVAPEVAAAAARRPLRAHSEGATAVPISAAEAGASGGTATAAAGAGPAAGSPSAGTGTQTAVAAGAAAGLVAAATAPATLVGGAAALGAAAAAGTPEGTPAGTALGTTPAATGTPVGSATPVTAGMAARATATAVTPAGGPPAGPDGTGRGTKDGPPWMVIAAATLAVAVLIAIVALAVRGSPKTSLATVSATTVPTTSSAPATTAATAAPTLEPPSSSTTATTSTTLPAAGHLQLDSASVDLGAANASARVLLSNTGPGPVAWKVSVGPAWLAVTPAAGTLAAKTSQTVTVAVDRSRVPPGTFSVQVAFVATGTGSVSAVLSVTGSQPAPTTTSASPTTTTTAGATSTTAPSSSTTSTTAGH